MLSSFRRFDNTMSSPQFSTRPFPRTSQACDRCRVRKIRCMPSTDPQKCRRWVHPEVYSSTKSLCTARCLSGSAMCVFSSLEKVRRTVYRPREPRNLVALNERLLLLDSNREHVAGSTRFGDSEYSGDQAKETSEFERLHRKAFRQLLSTFTTNSSGRPGPDASRSSNVSQPQDKTVAPEWKPEPQPNTSEIKRCLSRYESLQHYFPFVPLPQHWSVKDMKEEHEFMLLGILSAITIHETEVNVRLHSQFLCVLAEKAVMRNEKSLDIIQGILIQIAW
jgi:hypothetical protein